MIKTQLAPKIMAARPGVAPTVSFLTVAEAENSPELQRDWKALVDARPHLFAGYQSLFWLRHVQNGLPLSDQVRIAVVRNQDRTAGVVPLRIGRFALPHNLRLLNRRAPLKSVQVIGHRPPLAESAPLYDDLLSAIYEHFPECECVLLRMVPVGSFTLQHLSTSPTVAERFIFHSPPHIWNHSICLPTTFPEYQAHFKPKHRYNLQRAVRLLRQRGQGSLELVRYESPADVDLFLAHTNELVRKTWQFHSANWLLHNQAGSRAELIDLAERGFLRSYVLHCGGRPCAYVYGYQIGEVYHYDQPGYDNELARFSPGTALLYLLIEDLYGHHAARFVSFGFGDAGYKQTFANRHSEDAVVYLLRRNLRNRLRLTVLRGLSRLRHSWKGWRQTPLDQRRRNSRRRLAAS